MFNLTSTDCKEIEANLEMAKMLSGDKEAVELWASRSIMDCNGRMLNDLIRLARTMKAN